MIQLDYFLYQLKVKLISFHVDCFPSSSPSPCVIVRRAKPASIRFYLNSYQDNLHSVPSYFSLLEQFFTPLCWQ